MIKKSYLKIVAILLAIILSWQSSLAASQYSEIFEQLMKRIESDYTGQTSRQELFEAAMKGMFERLDKYSEFFTAQEVKQFEQNINRSFEGIGIQFRRENEKFVVVSLIAGGSAKEGGVLVGDVLISADGTDFKHMKSTEEVAAKILGEKGTRVKLRVQRGQKFLDFHLERRALHLPTVEQLDFQELKPAIPVQTEKTLYFSLNSFGEETAWDFQKLLAKPENQKAEVLILDLRDNGGGYVSAVVEIANLLIAKSKIVSFRDKNGQTEDYYSDLEKAPFKKVITLINHNSASASEILAGALKDSGMGLLIGETTYGKGVAQEFLTINGGEYAAKLTYRQFFTPKGYAINEKGVKPHIEIKTPAFISADRRFFLGDRHEGILQVEEILKYLGYFKGKPDDFYQAPTMTAILNFQKAMGLGQHQVIDFTTQEALNQALRMSLNEKDPVFLRALQESQKFLLTDGK